MNVDGTVSVLLLEDDAEDYRLVVRHMRSERCKYVIDRVESLAEAIQALDRRTYDVVLTDLCVPDSQGLETVTSLKEHCGEAPIIVITGTDDENVERDFLRVGAQEYLLKGELGGRAVARLILHAVQRQRSINKVNALVHELEQSRQLLQRQAQLLQKKNHSLRRLYKTAQEIVDNVSHDFRTPLTVIKDYVAIIREGMVGTINEEQQTMLDKVSIRADDLNIMVDDLLDVSKLESGLLGAWRRNVCVEDIVKRAQSLLQQRAMSKSIEFTVECASELPEVYCDADKVVRVITNLAVNAFKFVGEKGWVRLWVEFDPAAHEVVVGVSDNGPGIDEGSLKRIFRRFQQLNSEAQSSARGFGLGLNIAQQLCRLNLGELNVQSQVGKGSTFSFSIPIADPIEIFDRWLTLREECDDMLRVIEVTVEPGGQPAEADDFDSFLNYLLRGDDLLLRTSRCRWLMVIAAPPTELDRWDERTASEFAKANRNRPLGPLPRYRVATCGEWLPRDQAAPIVKQFATIVRQESAVVEM